MARYLLVTLLVALVCVMQAHSVPADASTPDPLQDIMKNAQDFLNSGKIQEAMKENWGSLTETFNNAMKAAQPQIDKFKKDTQEFLDGVIPKTEEEKKP